MSALLIFLSLLVQDIPAAPGPGQGQTAPEPSGPQQGPLAEPPGPVPAPQPQPGAAAPGAPAGAPGVQGDGEPQQIIAVRPATMLREELADWQYWAFIYGDPRATIPGVWGDLLEWIKIVSMISLIGWLGAWVVFSVRDRREPKFKIGAVGLLDALALASVFIGLACVFLRVGQAAGQVPLFSVGGLPITFIIALVALGVIVLWAENLMWGGVRRSGGAIDLLVLLGVHVAFMAGLGLAATLNERALIIMSGGLRGFPGVLLIGGQAGLTFMSYLVFLRVALLVLGEVFALRSRRLYALGRFSWIESFRKTRIPWAVIAIFLVILAFTHWFLVPPDQQRQAELSRLYVGTLMLLCSVLITVMVAILTPITLPNDIRFQTIFTVVTKPVRRLEVVWGRMFGFMAVVTVLVLGLGGLSLIYLDRNVGSRVEQLRAQVEEARLAGDTTKLDLLEPQLDQLETRLSARVPIDGSLTFIDSLNQPRIRGIDVGQELEIRSHIEGATQAKAIWQFGPNLPHPLDRLGLNRQNVPLAPVDAPVRLDLLLKPGTIEYLGNRIYEYAYEIVELEARKREGVEAAELNRVNNRIEDLQRQIEAVSEERESLIAAQNELFSQADEAESNGDADEAERLRAAAAEYNSPEVPVQMTFTVYRTTKGRVVGEPVGASIQVLHPFVAEGDPIPGDPLFGGQESNPLIPEYVTQDIFDIKEYYTNKWSFPASMLIGSRGYLTIEVRCLSPSQYLGMSESDLFLVGSQGSFWVNYLKGLFGIWLKAMVITAVGVWAGTFLSWPVALLTTLFVFGAGEMLFPILSEIASNTMEGGGPFESMIRLVTHENQMSELDATLGVIIARSFDAIVVPLMSLLIYVVPNFSAMDMSGLVADGFAISGRDLLRTGLLAFAYALPFSIAGYFVLKNREVAA